MEYFIFRYATVLLNLFFIDPAASLVDYSLFVQKSNGLDHIQWSCHHSHLHNTKQKFKQIPTSVFTRRKHTLKILNQSRSNDLDYTDPSHDPLNGSSNKNDHSVLPISEKNNEVAIEIVYENKSYRLPAYVGESILSALERNQASISRLPLPPIPHDCRKGCCMTCSGRVLCASSAPDSNHPTSLVRGDDGLNPSLSKQVESEGYALLCSSFAIGPGIKIEIGCKEEVWNLTYKDRMSSDSETGIRSAAVAKNMRLASEKNIPKWTEKAERLLNRT